MTTRSATRRKPSIVTHLTLMLIQPTTAPDLAPITEIYRHHVLHGSGSFETVPPDVAEMQQRWQNVTAQGMPHLVLRQGDRVLGYAYAHALTRWCPVRFQAIVHIALLGGLFVVNAAFAATGLPQRAIADMMARGIDLLHFSIRRGTDAEGAA